MARETETSAGQRRQSTDVVGTAAPVRQGDSFFVGVMLLLLVVLLWTASNFLTNYQLTQGYDKPFAVTYLNTSSFAIYMIPFACVFSWQKRGRTAGNTFEGVLARMGFYLPSGSLWRSRTSSYSPVPVDEEPANDVVAAPSTRRPGQRPSSIDGRRPRDPALEAQTAAPPLDLHDTAKLAGHFMIVWFLANYCLNVSLKLTSVASATTLSSASGFFTLALGSLAGVEVFSLPKLLAVSMSFTGVLLVMRADSSSFLGVLQQPAADNPFLGDLLALASAFFYTVYVVLLKKRIGDESRVSMPLFFGFVGVFNITLMWPVGLLLHFTGVELLEWPSTRLMWTGVVVNMSITFVSDMAYLLAMLKSSPLVATVGLSLTIPLATLGDALRGSHTGGLQSYWGSFIVLASFVAIGLADRALARRNVL